MSDNEQTTADSQNAKLGDQTARDHVWTGESFSGLLKGKVAVVTGAARGIGRAIAVDLAATARRSSASTSPPASRPKPSTTQPLRRRTSNSPASCCARSAPSPPP